MSLRWREEVWAVGVWSWREDRWVGRGRWRLLRADFETERVWMIEVVFVSGCEWRHGLFAESVSAVMGVRLAATCASPGSCSGPYLFCLSPHLALRLYVSALLFLWSSSAPCGASLADLWIDSCLAASL